MASNKKAIVRRARRFNQQERDEQERCGSAMPDFLVRIVGWERLRSVSNRIVLQHWRD